MMRKNNLIRKLTYFASTLLLFCIAMILMLGTPKSARADIIETNNLIVCDSNINFKNDQWTIMFEAQIDKASYDVITNNGNDAVSFGLLIGPTKRVDQITDYNSAIEQQFVSIMHVGTENAVKKSSSDNCSKIIDFGKDPTNNSIYKYEAGIIYNQEKLSSLDLGEVANLELTAIPVISFVDSQEVVLGNAKSYLPKSELITAVALDDKQEYSQDYIRAFIGDFNKIVGEYYVCQSTNRFMGTKIKGGDLKEISLAGYSENDQLFIGDKQAPSILDADFVEDLTSNDQLLPFIIYKENGQMDLYSAKIAKRVILRMFREDSYIDNSPASNLKDYYAFMPTDEERADYPLAYQLVYVGLFYNRRVLIDAKYYSAYTIDGLFVLGNKITPRETKSVAINNSDYYTGGYAMENKGFIGTFDGRGNVMDFNYRETGVYAYCGGIFNSLYGATIRDVAFLNLRQYGSQRNFISLGAHKVNFENVYITIAEATHFNSFYNFGLLMQDVKYCTFNNFVVECDLVDYRYSPGVGLVDIGDGISTSGLLMWDYAEGEGAHGYNKAENFFAVGSTPIYFDITNPITPSSRELVTTLTNYMVNEEEEFYYNLNADIYGASFKGQKIEMNTTTIYREYQFWNSPYQNRFEEIMEFVRFGYILRWNEDALYSVEGQKGVEIRFCKSPGFRHVADYKEMNAYLKKSSNANKLNNFITNGNDCWTVNNATGQVSWKKMEISFED